MRRVGASFNRTQGARIAAQPLVRVGCAPDDNDYQLDRQLWCLPYSKTHSGIGSVQVYS